MPTSLTASLWPGMLAWVVLYVSDFVFTLYCASLHQKYVREIFVVEGSYELTPMFQKDVDSGRWLSPRFLLWLVLSSAFLAIIWDQSRRPPAWPQGYEFVLGFMLLLELAIHVRHVHNTFYYRLGFVTRRVRGRLECPRSLGLRMSAVDLAAFGVVFGIVFLATGSPLLLGGAVSCLFTAYGHLGLARRQARREEARPGEPSGVAKADANS